MAVSKAEPQFKPKNGFYKFDHAREDPPAGSYDPAFGIKECKGLNNFASSICWLSKDKLTFYVKFNLGPYDWGMENLGSGCKHKGWGGMTKRGFWEGVTMLDSYTYPPGDTRPKHYSSHLTYVQMSTKENGVKLRMSVNYQIHTGGAINTTNGIWRDAPGFWFSHVNLNGKYRGTGSWNANFNDACPKPFEDRGFRCKPINISGSTSSWKENTTLSGWCPPVYDSVGDHRAISRGTNYKKTWTWQNSHKSGTKTMWYDKYNCEKRGDDPASNYWVSDTNKEQEKPLALRKHPVWVWDSQYQDYVVSGGIIVWPNPPSAPILEVDPADGIHGTIRVKYNHKNKPGLDPEPVDITVVGKSEYMGEDTVLFISKMTSGGSQEEDVIFREHGFAEGYHIKYQATAVDSFKQTASSDWVGGHHYNKTPDAPEGWVAASVVPTETKPYTKVHVTHEPADDIEHDNVTYELKYEFYNEDGSVAVPMRTLSNKSEGDFGEMTITNVSDGGRLEFWSTPKDDKEHDRYSDTAHFVYKKGYAATRPEQVWPKEKSIVRNKRPRIIIKNGIRKGMNAPEVEQKIFVRWMDIWYNNEDHKQYFSSDSTHVGYYTVFKPPTDCFSVDGKVSVSVKAHNGCSESKTLDRIFFYKEFEHEKVIPLKSNHVNLLKVAIDDERDAYELEPFVYNRDHGENTNDILVLKDEIVFNEDYNSLADSIIEVNEYINGIDKTANTDYTNYEIPDIKDLDLIDQEFAEWQKLLTMVKNI